MPTPDPPSRDVYSISRLNTEVRTVLEGSFPLVWVEGEISNLAMPRSGHLYFSLKDANAQVRCALFRNRRQLLRFQPGNGDQVLARARVGFYEPRGDFQLIIEHMEPAGAGSAQRAFEALKQKLQAEGLFDSGRKRDLPPFPRRIGVITSPSGAAIRDVLNVLERRAPQIAVTIFPAQVQGQDAPTDLVEALQVALARRDCDLLLLTRGGGSAEDLAAFNDERLARLIADAEIPIVSAVGHEIDFTIADFVADRRAPTPSAAAELISPDGDELTQRLTTLAGRLAGAARRRLDERTRHLALASDRLQRLSPRNRLRQQEQRLDELDLRLARTMRGDMAIRNHSLYRLQHRLEAQSPRQRLALLAQRFKTASSHLGSAMQAALEKRSRHLSATARELNAVSPLATLQRGYSVLRDPATGGVIGSVESVTPGDKLEAMLADGRIEMTAGKIFRER
jgi:exodeoxyribonuclease VII large subunit